MQKRATGNNGPEPGDSFETTAVLTGDHLSHFGINQKFVEIYGIDRSQPVLDVRCTIKEKDLSVKEIYNSSVKYRKILFYILFEVHRTCYCLFSHSLKFG